MWALPANELCYLVSSQSMNTAETFKGGTRRDSIVSPSILTKHVKHNANVGVGTSRESILLPDTLSKRVEHSRNIEYWHSQLIHFVAWHLVKACKTKHKIYEPDVPTAAWMEWSCIGPLAA